MNNRPGAVIFDMDGVLVDNAHYHHQAWTIFCRRYGVIEKLDHLAMFGKSNRDYLEMCFGELKADELMRLSAEKESIYQEIFGPLMQPVNGLLPFLRILAENTIAIALATSGPAMNVKFILTELDISPYFGVCVDEKDVSHGKPHPEVYLVTAGKLGLPPGDCLVMEDSIHGISAAHAAGMKVVGINTGRDRDKIREADLVVEDFTELNLDRIRKLYH